MKILRSTNLSLIAGLFATCLILFFLSTTSRGQTLTDVFFDPIRNTPNRNEVVIVGIDDKSLQTLGAWPWNRDIFAQLHTALAESDVKAIAYDVLFLEQREGDDAFLASLRKYTVPTFLASKVTEEGYVESYLLGNERHVKAAFANVSPDTDGKVRKYPEPIPVETHCVYGLAEYLFKVITFSNTNTCENTAEKTSFRYPNDISTYSVADVVQGKITTQELKGKVVLVGSTALDLPDHFISLTGEKIPGVYVHASMLTSLLNNVSDRRASNATALLCFSAIILGLTFVLSRTERLVIQLVTVISALLAVLICSGVLFHYGILIPAPWLLFAIIITSGYITFAKFIKERNQNKYIQTLFSKYVHKDVLAELIRSDQPIRLGGEKKTVSILFSDLRGFTTLSEKLSAEELTGLLNTYFSAMTPHILEERGTIDKFIGDAIMAFWNAPLTISGHTTHAINAALRMHKALSNFNTTHNTTLEMGIGVHRGEVVVGNVGGEDRVNYTILGDTVNLTSRLEGLTKKYGVKTLITEETYLAIAKEEYLLRLIDIITVKGKTTPTKIYEIREKTDSNLDVFELYEKAFGLYQKGLWSEAKDILVQLDDAPSRVLLERILLLEKESSKTWDGIWKFDEK